MRVKISNSFSHGCASAVVSLCASLLSLDCGDKGECVGRLRRGRLSTTPISLLVLDRIVVRWAPEDKGSTLRLDVSLP